LYYNNIKAEWKFGAFPIPAVIYRRDFHSKSKNIKKLIEITRDRMFNSSRFTKLYLYEHAKKIRNWQNSYQILRDVKTIKKL